MKSNVLASMRRILLAALVALLVLPTVYLTISASPRNPDANRPLDLRSITSRTQDTMTVFLPIAQHGLGQPQDADDVEEIDSDGRFTLEGVSLDVVNPVTSTLTFRVSGAQLTTDIERVHVVINEFELAPSHFQLLPDAIQLDEVLQSGRNDILIFAEDDNGNQLNTKTTIWAGDSDLTVVVVDENDLPLDGISVRLSVVDDQTLTAEQTTAGGQTVFTRVPGGTILVEARDDNNRYASFGTTGYAGTIQLRLIPFHPPSPIDNNDFAEGNTDGWIIGDAPVEIIPHGEEVVINGIDASDAGDQGFDLVLRTSGEGPRSISRSFTVAPDTQNVRVRYRFVTSEVPGGWFGSEYNDYFSVVIRSQNAGELASEANSMNGLGLAAFDAGGATAWRETSLPVGEQGDTIQVDVTVANVADDLFDSAVVVDAIYEETLQIQADREQACINEAVTFTPVGDASDPISWSGGENPASGTGTEFVTRFLTHGEKTVTGVKPDVDPATASVTIKENSGAQWVARFPTSRAVADLTPAFGGNVSNFINALNGAGATVNISATYRPVERAYLMHYAWRIAREGLDPAQVPAREGVDICWLHLNTEGAPDQAASQAAAAAMVQAYNIVHRPALTSRHTERLAIDMTITWTGDLEIVNGNGETVTITSTPRNGNNAELHQVGATYGVNKLVTDPPHWSSDGR